MRIRAYEDGDDVAAVVAEAYAGDPELAGMSLGLHGRAREAPPWRRTLVAVDGGEIAGVGSAAASRRHPGSAPVGIAVRAGSRRRGIGSALLAAVREEIGAFDPPPLWSTVDGGDPAAAGFAVAHGFGVVLRYGTWRLDPALVALPAAGTPALTSAAELTEEQLLDTLAALDRWSGNLRLAEPTPREVLRADVLPHVRRDAGAVASVGGQPIAAGLLGDFDGDLVALCDAAPDQPVELITALLGRLLAAAGDRPVDVEVVLDGGALAVLVTNLAGARRRCDRIVLGEGRGQPS